MMMWIIQIDADSLKERSTEKKVMYQRSVSK